MSDEALILSCLLCILLCVFYILLRVSGKNQKTTCEESEIEWTHVFLLLFLAGGIGAHRFYVGKRASGFLYLLTLGLFSIGVIVDMIQFLCGNFTDSKGNVITKDKKSQSVVVNNKPSTTDQLREFSKLRDEGVLTEEEFQAKKMELLS